MMGAGILPGPFARADEAGLDDDPRAARARPGASGATAFEPPTVLRRLVAQGRLGKKTGQGFFPYPQPDAGDQRETVLLETRGDIAIAWLNRPPANPLSPQAVRGPDHLWERGRGEGAGARDRLVEHLHVQRRRGHQGVHEDDAGRRGRRPRGVRSPLHARDGARRSTVTIAAVNSIAFGGGCELAMACDFRIAAESATFGQPEINLGIIPGFGGTQRLPRLVGEAKALEMNLAGDPIDAYEAHRVGLANQVVPDHELFDTALAWARKLAEQAPIAVEEIKKRSHSPDLDEGLDEAEGFARAFGSEDAKEGIARLPRRSAAPKFKGE